MNSVSKAVVHHTEEDVVEQNISRKGGLKAERGEAPWLGITFKGA